MFRSIIQITSSVTVFGESDFLIVVFINNSTLAAVELNSSKVGTSKVVLICFRMLCLSHIVYSLRGRAVLVVFDFEGYLVANAPPDTVICAVTAKV